MISRISGKIKHRGENFLHLEVQGICYEVLVPGCIMQMLDGVITDGAVELVTYHYYQMEPSRSIPVLIGFINEIEREFFEKFITVSGIGPRAAVKALSVPISTIARAIDNGDHALLQTLPGIGPQRAREVIAKLQGKVGKFGLIQDNGLKSVSHEENIQEEAIDVLLQLQYKRNEAQEMVKKALQRSPGIKTVEDVLNEVYRERRAKES
ncbi:MAG: Holliday junction branch migration protein RuvA [Candidatus Omnitrophica bacterium]|nr:Holliday junction branch migration protein RuvA [Candidatus Omnitrophota bacterium]